MHVQYRLLLLFDSPLNTTTFMHCFLPMDECRARSNVRYRLSGQLNKFSNFNIYIYIYITIERLRSSQMYFVRSKYKTHHAHVYVAQYTTVFHMFTKKAYGGPIVTFPLSFSYLLFTYTVQVHVYTYTCVRIHISIMYASKYHILTLGQKSNLMKQSNKKILTAQAHSISKRNITKRRLV